MMTFNEFLESAKARVQEELPDAEVKIQPVNKLQGESYVGIAVQPEGAAAAVTFNVGPAYEHYQMDPSQENGILSKIAADAKQVSSSIPAFEVTSITDYESVKNHLVMQVVPVEPNKEMLKTIPHKTVEDIVVVYRVELPHTADSSATTLVTNQLLDQYGITPEQLHADAVAAQLANHPPVLKNMSEMMAEMSGGMFDMPESPMWVATVEGGMNGASVTQLPDFLQEAADRLGGDFFVLPSSVHEVLFIRDDGSFEREQLESMVRGVNATEVSEADFLSDSVYNYDSDDHVFEKAVTFESRVAEQTAVYAAESPAPAVDTMTVLLVEPEKYPRPVEIGTELSDLQEAVGGYIEVVYPFDEPVGLIMNEEGKLEGLPLNRALRDDEGQIYDVVAGSFLVVGLTEESFGSLSPDQMQKFDQQFHQPEVFIQMGKGIMALPIPDEAVKLHEEKAVAKAVEEKKPDLPGKKPHKKTQETAL